MGKYDIPEDEISKLVLSKIKRIRAQGEKLKREGFFERFSPSSCEICGSQALYGISQCPHCGRWVGGQFSIEGKPYEQLRKMHESCYDKTYGCCKICATFIRENTERLSCPYCRALFYKFQNSCPNCGAPQIAPQKTPSHTCADCQKPLKFIPQYQRWYCYNCRKYAPKE